MAAGTSRKRPVAGGTSGIIEALHALELRIVQEISSLDSKTMQRISDNDKAVQQGMQATEAKLNAKLTELQSKLDNTRVTMWQTLAVAALSLVGTMAAIFLRAAAAG